MKDYRENYRDFDASRRFLRGCLGKVSYCSRRRAWGAVRVTLRDDPRHENQHPLRPYKCGCGAWHVGHDKYALRDDL